MKGLKTELQSIVENGKISLMDLGQLLELLEEDAFMDTEYFESRINTLEGNTEVNRKLAEYYRGRWNLLKSLNVAIDEILKSKEAKA